MRSTLIRTTLFAVLAMTMAAFGQTTAATGPAPGGGAAPAPTGPAPTRIGVINIDRIIEETNDGKRMFADLQKKYEAKDAELKNAATELQNLQKTFQVQSDKMNDDERTRRAKEIDQKQRALQQNVEAARADFQADQNEIAQNVLKKLEPVVKKYATDNGYAVILDASRQTTWAAPQADISEALIAAYNAANPSAAPAPSTARPAARPPAAGTSTQPKPPAPKPQ
jgi:outer membrane protein